MRRRIEDYLPAGFLGRMSPAAIRVVEAFWYTYRNPNSYTFPTALKAASVTMLTNMLLVCENRAHRERIVRWSIEFPRIPRDACDESDIDAILEALSHIIVERSRDVRQKYGGNPATEWAEYHRWFVACQRVLDIILRSQGVLDVILRSQVVLDSIYTPPREFWSVSPENVRWELRRRYPEAVHNAVFGYLRSLSQDLPAPTQEDLPAPTRLRASVRTLARTLARILAYKLSRKHCQRELLGFIVEEEEECKICMMPYNNNLDAVRILTCQNLPKRDKSGTWIGPVHSLCSRCMENIRQCPFCRKERVTAYKLACEQE